jgi:fatty-acyl-CoA synthase
MLGYWNNPQATRDAIDTAGWLHSGDLGVMSADGLINITGRKKDMIIRGGENIYPREIEEVLHEHAGVAQAQVFGVPNERLGEEVAVWMMVKKDYQGTPDEIIEWLGTRIAHYKVPSHVRVVETFPMTVTGKIQKFAMREVMVAELGLQVASEVQTA